MKKPHHTKATSIADSRWLAYATAGLATSIGGAESAQADIHYSGPRNVLFQAASTHAPARERFSLGAGSAYIGFVNKLHTYSNYGIAGFFVKPGAFNGYIVNNFGSRVVSKLASGDDIAALPFIKDGPGNQSFLHTKAGLLLYYLYGFGHWNKGDTAFVGFRFNQGNGTQYGWARVRIEDFGGENYYRAAFTLVDYAYGDPGDRVTAGQISLAPRRDHVSIPTEGSLGLLALGATGLFAWREKRKVART